MVLTITALLVFLWSIATIIIHRFKYKSISLDTYVICSTILSAAAYIVLMLLKEG